MARDYEGPYRHVHVSVVERDGGLSVSVHEFEIFRGKRRWKKAWPPIYLTSAHRPQTVATLLVRVGLELDDPAGLGPAREPRWGGGGNPQA